MLDLVHPLMAEIVGKTVPKKEKETVSVMATISGAKAAEVCVMGTLTANLHLMMSQFYKPTPERYKLLCEARAFPSDQVSGLCIRPSTHTHATVSVRFRFPGSEPRA